MAVPSIILRLPFQVQMQIFNYLSWPDTACLRNTCRTLRANIPKPTHSQILQAESTVFALQKRLYSCRYCICLRPASKFSDDMLVNEKAKQGAAAHKRFCVDCGITKPSGPGKKPRYRPGIRIRINRKEYVNCFRCHKLGDTVHPAGFALEECSNCWGKTRINGIRRQLSKYGEDHTYLDNNDDLEAYYLDDSLTSSMLSEQLLSLEQTLYIVERRMVRRWATHGSSRTKGWKEDSFNFNEV